MNPIWRERIVAVIAALLAVWLAFELAQGAIVLPMLVMAITLAAVLTRFSGVSIDAIAVSALLCGYIVGNRGFAQLTPVPGLPLLPAEMGLALTGACLLWRCARDKSLPWLRDPLDHALLAWMIVGTARFAFDFPRHGFVAVRDFATVYYAGFYFVVQKLAQEERVRRFLFGSLFLASAILPLVFALSEIFPSFFLGTLVLHGVPLVYFKGDLAPTFMAVASVVLFLTSPTRHRWWARTLATAMLLWVFSGDNRASTLAAIVALAWAFLSRFRRFALWQGAALAVTLLALIALAGVFENPWAVHRAQGLTERIVSVVDLGGRYSYQQEASISKTGNNQFRWVWWQTVVTETLSTNPALGLGFGYDLARGFLQEYNPELAEDFTTRSPHNIFVTVLGRMGLVGLFIFLWIVSLLTMRTWRAVRNPATDAMGVAFWVALWPIGVSACLGVVLEGPMGAVIFWTLLGLAQTHRSAEPGSNDELTGNAEGAAAAEIAPPAEPAAQPALPAPGTRS